MIRDTISVFAWVILFSAAWRRPCLSYPIYENEYDVRVNTTEKYAHVRNNVTELAYDKEDIVSALAAEFLFLVAGDHVFLPPPSDSAEDFELHRNARLLASLLTKLNCTRRIYALFNETAQDVAEQRAWDEPGHDRHLFTVIFEQIVDGLKRLPEANTLLLREKNTLPNGSVRLAEFHGQLTTNETRTFYDLPSHDLPALEQLLDSELVKKVVLTIELLVQAEEKLADVPEAAKLYRRRLETVKGLFALATSDKEEIRLRTQKIFDDALGEALPHFEMIDVLGYKYQDDLCDALLRKIQNDDLVREEFYCLKNDLI